MGAVAPSPSLQLPDVFQCGTFMLVCQGSSPLSLAAHADLLLPVCHGGSGMRGSGVLPDCKLAAAGLALPGGLVARGRLLNPVWSPCCAVVQNELLVLPLHKLFASSEFGMMSPLSTSALVLAQAAPPALACTGSCNDPLLSREISLSHWSGLPWQHSLLCSGSLVARNDGAFATLR